MGKSIWGAGLVVGLVLTVSGRGEEGPNPKAILDKAINAHGGAELLKKYTAQQTKSKGKFYGFGDGIDYTAESSLQLPDKVRTTIEGPMFKFVQVINGDKGWVSANDDTNEMNMDQLEAGKGEIYASKLSHLVTITGPDYKLTPLGEVKVDDKPALGIRVEHKGQKDVSLFFDKDSGLLVKSERKAKDGMSGEEYTATTFYSGYKKVEGVQVPHKITVNKDGNKLVEQENTECKLAEKLDDKLFTKP
jgi:hypothetical protein